MNTKVKDFEVVEAKASNKNLNLELKKKSELAFLICKYMIWESELEKGWIMTKWYKTTKKGTNYKIKPAKDQVEFDKNVTEFRKLEKEIHEHGEKEIKKSMKILSEGITLNKD